MAEDPDHMYLKETERAYWVLTYFVILASLVTS